MIRWMRALRAQRMSAEAHELYRKASLANATGQFSAAIMLRQQADKMVGEAKRLAAIG